MHDRRRWRIAAALAGLALVAAACAGSSTIDEYATSSSAPADTSRTEVGERAEPPTVTGESAFAIPAAPAPRPDAAALSIDDDYRVGALANGLTYLLRSNDSPGASLDLRLLVDAGSLQQAVGDDGSAHFLEHMMFNGTEAFPGNELSLALQRLGIAFGPDFNAYTSYDETVYLLEASTTDPTAPELAFEVLAQWAAAATIDPTEVEAEIGVVRDELRQGRESVDGIIRTAFEQIYTEGTDYEGHIVIGDPAKVEATRPDVLRTYYDDWYRPDNMAVVAVGDLSVDDLQRLVQRHFGDLEARTSDPPERLDVEVGLDATPRFEIVTHPDNAVDNLSLDFPLPTWDRSTVGGARLVLMEQVIGAMLRNRLVGAFQRGELVIDSEPFFDEFAITRELRYFGTNIQGDDLLAGLDQFLAELLGAAVAGFTPADLDRARVELRAGLDDEVAAIASTQDWVFASDLASYWLDSADLDDPARRLQRQAETLAELGVDELTDHWRWLLASSGPIVVAVGDDATTLPSAADMAEIMAGVQPAAGLDGAAEITELMARPDPVEPVASTRRPTLNGEVHEWRYANGVTVSFQHSTVEAGRFSLWSEEAGGWLALPPGSVGANASVPAIALGAVERSGAGEHDAATLGRFLESRSAFVFGFVDDATEGFVGGAASDDADPLFQLVHQRIVAPRLDDVGYRIAINEAEQSIARLRTNVDVQATEALIDLLSGGDTRYATTPDPAVVADLTAADLLRVYRDRLGTVAGLHVAVVGDLEAAAVEALASSYLGTLPAAESASRPGPGPDLPAGVRRAEVELPAGTADGGLIVAHLTDAVSTAEEAAAALVLQTIVDTRITEDIRETLGASYGGFSSLSVEQEPDPRLTSLIEIDGDPDRLEEIRSALLAALTELASDGPTDDEFARAASVVGNDWDFVDNALFLATNLAATRFPDGDHLTPDNRLDILSAMSPADVRTLAARLYGSGDHIEVAKVLP